MQYYSTVLPLNCLTSSGQCRIFLLVNQEVLGLSVVGRLDGSTAIDDGAYLELHSFGSLLAGGLYLRVSREGSVELVVVTLGIAVLVS